MLNIREKTLITKELETGTGRVAANCFGVAASTISFIKTECQRVLCTSVIIDIPENISLLAGNVRYGD